MAEDRGEIKIRYTLKQGKGDASGSETVHSFPVSSWKIYLILVPTFIAVAFLSAFLFSILFPLFLFAGIFLSLWMWWISRKLRKSKRAENLEGEYVVIEEARIVETKTDKEGEYDSNPYPIKSIKFDAIDAIDVHFVSGSWYRRVS